MRRFRRDVSPFSMSFLDLLTCALGGVLLLFIATMTSSRASVQRLEGHVVDLGLQVKGLKGERDTLAGKANELEAAVDGLTDDNKTLKTALTAVVALKGPQRNVVFVFDTSGSMAGKKNAQRMEDFKALLAEWVAGLPFERFTVIKFNDQVTAWQGTKMVTASPENRRQAVEYIRRFQATGDTNTLGALKAAFACDDVDTIVLFSDGAPSVDAINGEGKSFDVYSRQILDWMDSRARKRGVTVNTVAIGDYFLVAPAKAQDNSAPKPFGVLLKEIARLGGGRFIGLD